MVDLFDYVRVVIWLVVYSIRLIFRNMVYFFFLFDDFFDVLGFFGWLRYKNILGTLVSDYIVYNNRLIIGIYVYIYV